MLGHFFFRYRDALFPVVLIGLAALSRPVPGDNRRLYWAAFGAGATLALLGQALRVLVIGLRYIRRGGKDRAIYADHLVQDGIFAHSRNPLYLGNILILIGVLVTLNGFWAYVIGLPFIALVYSSIVMAEERYLQGRFGADYSRYCARVPRFGFRVSGLRAKWRSTLFDWQRVIRKEYGTPFAWVSIMIGIVIWKDAAATGVDAARPGIRWLLIVWVVWLVAYLSARFLKKTDRLGSDSPAAGDPLVPSSQFLVPSSQFLVPSSCVYAPTPCFFQYRSRPSQQSVSGAASS